MTTEGGKTASGEGLGSCSPHAPRPHDPCHPGTEQKGQKVRDGAGHEIR
jgi:hypothetical protein